MKGKPMAIMLACLVLAGLASAQVYYTTLVGTVRDASGALIPDAKITVTEVRTGVAASAASDEAGNYRIATLRPGVYSISVTKPNFKTQAVNDVELFVGQTTRIDITLEVGDVMQKISVVGQAPLVQTDSAERGIVMQRREIEALPLNERNITELTYLLPGAVRSSAGGEPVPDINGLGASRDHYYVDVGGSTSYYQGAPVERVSVDTVEEFKVETALMTADRGLKAGSITPSPPSREPTSFMASPMNSCAMMRSTPATCSLSRLRRCASTSSARRWAGR